MTEFNTYKVRKTKNGLVPTLTTYNADGHKLVINDTEELYNVTLPNGDIKSCKGSVLVDHIMRSAKLGVGIAKGTKVELANR
jgi:hypothetical protein